VTALVTFDDEVAPGARADDPAVRAQLDALVASVNERLARVEQIKRYAVLPTAWTPESGEVTPTLKLKRRVIHDRYADEIAALYS
jgi:long-chain acyl-CoA synthetase